MNEAGIENQDLVAAAGGFVFRTRRKGVTMKIYLARHGSAVHPAQDPTQPLSDVGREEVQIVAEKMRDLGAVPAWVEHSTKARAAETAEILAAVLAAGAPRTPREDLLPNRVVDAVAAELIHCEQEGLLVGHLPFMPHLARELMGPEAKELISFPTASVLCLERVGEGRWEKRWMVSP